jgi:hypothetical protein
MKVYKVIIVNGDAFKLEEELNWLTSLGADIVSVMYIPDDVYHVVYSHDNFIEVEDDCQRRYN